MATTTSQFTRLYLVPVLGVQQIIDVPSAELILSDGKWVSPAVAKTVTLTSTPVTSEFQPFKADESVDMLVTAGQQEVRICFREPSDIQQYPDTDVMEATDPSGGECICGITCQGPELKYVKVLNVPAIV